MYVRVVSLAIELYVLGIAALFEKFVSCAVTFNTEFDFLSPPTVFPLRLE